MHFAPNFVFGEGVFQKDFAWYVRAVGNQRTKCLQDRRLCVRLCICLDSIFSFLLFMTHIISDKKVIINGMEHVVTAVDGLDRVDINNKLHYLNVEMDKLRQKQESLLQMRNMIDFECERREMQDKETNLFEEMFGG